MTTWTPDRIEEVTRLWNEGLTTAQIGKRIGVSKNAVVGKAHRLGLAPRPSPIRREASLRPPRPPVVRPVAPRPTIVIGIGTAACKWPDGHPGEPNFVFCGSPALVGKPYCRDHYAKAYVHSRPSHGAA